MRRIVLSVLALGTFMCGLAAAQDFPTRPIRIITPYAPGATDVLLRSMAPALEKALGQPIVVEPRDGAGGAIALNLVRTSPPDGYTLLFSNIPTLTVPPLARDTGFTPNDFVPLGTITSTATGMIARANAPFKTLDELLVYAKANPGKVKIGHGGVGTSTHLIAEVFMYLTKIDMLRVPFRGITQAVTAALQGEVDVLIGYPSIATSHVEAGTLRYIALLDEKRSPGYPNLQTFRDSGVDLVDDVKTSFFAPKGLPPAVAKRLEDAIKIASQSPEYREYLTKVKAGHLYLSAAETAAEVAKHQEAWRGYLAVNENLRKALQQ